MEQRAHGERARVGLARFARLATVAAAAALVVAASVPDAAAGQKAPRDARSRSKGRYVSRTVERSTPRGHVVRRVERWRSDCDRVVTRCVERRWSPPVCDVRPRVVRRWSEPPRRIVHCRKRPYFWQVNLGVFLPDVWVDVTLGDAPPCGYVYVDRYCGERFATLDVYRAHCHSHGHPAAIDIVEIDDRWGHECDGRVAWGGECR
jgi:hypothetical protein